MPEILKPHKEEKPQFEEKPAATSREKGVSRREVLKTGLGILAYAAAGRSKEAAAALEVKINERKEGPNMEIEIFYGAHESGADIRGLAEKIKQTDVFVPEFAGENTRFLDILSAVSEGKISPQELFKERGIDMEKIKEGFEPFIAALFNAVYNTQKIILTFDLPAGHSLYGRLEDLDRYLIDTSLPFPQLLASYKRYLYESANVHREREQLMLRRLLVLKKDLAKGTIPQLSGKDKVKILLFLGAAHTGLYHQLKARGEQVSRGFPYKPFLLGLIHDEVRRRFAFGKEVSDELVARGLFGNVLYYSLQDQLSEISADTVLKMAFMRKITNAFGLEEIKDVLDRIREEGLSPPAAILLIHQRIAEKRIHLPTSEEELKGAAGYK